MRAWVQQVESAARRQWLLDPPYTGEVTVAITYFFDAAPLDVDNIPKPILDALKGLVYADDAQVTDLLCRKRNLNRDPRVPDASIALVTRLSHPGQFVHVVVDNT